MIKLDFFSLTLLETLSNTMGAKNSVSYFEVPLFTTADTGLSHRKVNELNHTGVIEDKRNSTKQWRKFSIVDVAIIKIADELVSYGFNKNSQLKAILNFITENGIEIASKNKSKQNDQYPIFVICSVLAMSDIPTYLVLTKEAVVGVFDFSEYKRWVDGEKEDDQTHLVVRMDTIIQPILRTLDQRLAKPNKENRRILEVPISDIQLKALRLIHSGQFTKIELRLGNGDIGLIKGFNYTTIRKGEKTATEIGNIAMKVSKHHTVSVYGDDGDVITLQSTATYKG